MVGREQTLACLEYGFLELERAREVAESLPRPGESRPHREEIRMAGWEQPCPRIVDGFVQLACTRDVAQHEPRRSDIQLRREELMLRGRGRISFGHPYAADSGETLSYVFVASDA